MPPQFESSWPFPAPACRASGTRFRRGCGSLAIQRARFASSKRREVATNRCSGQRVRHWTRPVVEPSPRHPPDELSQARQGAHTTVHLSIRADQPKVPAQGLPTFINNTGVTPAPADISGPWVVRQCNSRSAATRGDAHDVGGDACIESDVHHGSAVQGDAAQQLGEPFEVFRHIAHGGALMRFGIGGSIPKVDGGGSRPVVSFDWPYSPPTSPLSHGQSYGFGFLAEDQPHMLVVNSGDRIPTITTVQYAKVWFS